MVCKIDTALNLYSMRSIAEFVQYPYRRVIWVTLRDVVYVLPVDIVRGVHIVRGIDFDARSP